MTDNTEPTVQEKTAWAKVPQAFNDWWNGDYSDESNPFRINSAAYWAWAGWSEAVRLNAQAQQPLTDEKGALDLLNAENNRLMKLVIELRAEAARMNAQAVPDGYALVPVDAMKRWRDAFAEELSAWDIDPPLHHVQTSHDEIETLLSAAPAAPQPAPVEQTDARDAARWRYIAWHIGVAWNEQGFTSLVRIVSDKHREMLGDMVDRMMAGDWPEAAPQPAQPLTDEQIDEIWKSRLIWSQRDIARAIEQAHGIGVKND